MQNIKPLISHYIQNNANFFEVMRGMKEQIPRQARNDSRFMPSPLY